jgi:cobalt-precorrin-5B (C1)-methyltransferase
MNAGARAGYTLPVFACAAAIAALNHLQQSQLLSTVTLDLLEPPERVTIPIEQIATLPDQSVLAITRSDPGDNLDLTRHTPIWAVVQWGSVEQAAPIEIHGGEGIGHNHATGQAAIYAYAQRLLQTNLSHYLRTGEKIQVTIILPEGRSLALRTSNAAFGVVEGLSLLGTTGISQPLSAPEQLVAYRTELQKKAAQFPTLVFCVGENGLDLAVQHGVPPDCRIKTANWLGPLLIEAGLQGVQSILLFGYHGKLIKLAAGIFHTHHHVADGRLEILAAHCALTGTPTTDVQSVFASATADEALNYLRKCDTQGNTHWVKQVYGAIAHQIDQRTQAYIYTHSEQRVVVGSVLFDRARHIIVTTETGTQLLQTLQRL